jgi:catechol 2,3-dioxygenase-like lactoylglutathione lyase family enzyme
MLADSRVGPTLPVVDLVRARKFYEEKLGLQAVEMPEGVMYECGQGSGLVLYQRDTPTKADHTAAGWEVDNVEELVQTLGAKGVVFEQYDMPGLKTDEQGIATMNGAKGAWFKDTEGNILSVFQMA